jgi:hypothetical protein
MQTFIRDTTRRLALVAALCSTTATLAHAQARHYTRHGDLPISAGISIGSLQTEREGAGFSVAWMHSAQWEFLTMHAHDFDIGIMPHAPKHTASPYTSLTTFCPADLARLVDTTVGCGMRITWSVSGEMLATLPITRWSRAAFGVGDRLGSTTGVYYAGTYSLGAVDHFQIVAEVRRGKRFSDMSIGGTVPFKFPEKSEPRGVRRPGL